MKTIGSVVFAILTAIGMTGSGPAVDSITHSPDYSALLEAPSYVPAEERHTHIAGGFFSYFDSKTGYLSDFAGRAAGSVRFVLEDLGYESRFVYLPQGDISITDRRGRVRIFAMERLEYVRLPDSDLPAYRLSGDGVALIMTDTQGDVPSLKGELFVKRALGNERYLVSIHGRSLIEAESHLCKKMEDVSGFSYEEVMSASSTKLEIHSGDGTASLMREIARAPFPNSATSFPRVIRDSFLIGSRL